MAGPLTQNCTTTGTVAACDVVETQNMTVTVPGTTGTTLYYTTITLTTESTTVITTSVPGATTQVTVTSTFSSTITSSFTTVFTPPPTVTTRTTVTTSFYTIFPTGPDGGGGGGPTTLPTTGPPPPPPPPPLPPSVSSIVQTLTLTETVTPPPQTSVGSTVTVSVGETEATLTFTAAPTEGPITVVIPTTVEQTLTETRVTTAPAAIYVTPGETTLRRTFVVEVTATAGPAPVTRVYTDIEPGRVVTIVDDSGAQGVPVVATVDDVVTTVYTPPPQVVVSTIPGGFTTVVITTTPVPAAGGSGGSGPITLFVATTIGGETQTIVQTQPPQTVLVTGADGVVSTTVTTPPPQTVTTVIGGTLTSVPVVTTPAPGADAVGAAAAGFQPITYTGVITVDGRLVTTVITTTPGADTPLTLTVVSALPDRVVTLTTTPEPTTIVTTISGRLTTIVSTPGPRTFLSTIPGTTRVFTSVSTPVPTARVFNQTIVSAERFFLSNGEYFGGKFLPIMIAVTLAIPLRIIDLNSKLYQPFHTLAQPRGALGSESLTLQYSGLKGFLTPIKTLLNGHPVPFITSLIVLCTALLAPLATEAISLKIHGRCTISSIDGCALKLGVSRGPAYALMGVIGLIIVLLALLLWFLRHWRTGVFANPWNIAGIASLATNRDVHVNQLNLSALGPSAAGFLASSRDSILGRAKRHPFADRRYGLGLFETEDGQSEYGIVLLDESGLALRSGHAHDPDSESDVDGDEVAAATAGRPVVPFIALRRSWRVLFLLLVVGLLVLLTYYHLTLDPNAPDQGLGGFRRFMNAQSFGVRFLFAALGVAITFAWQALFLSVAIMAPFQAMAHRPQPPERSILLSRPTNAFYGTYVAVRERSILLLSVSVCAVLAEFLPFLLANVPFNLTQTLATHVVCARMSIAILAVMSCVVVSSLFVRWPRLPVDPRSIAGAMYYVAESHMLRDFEGGVSLLDRGSRDRRVREMGRRYYYGEIVGRTGRRRLGVDADMGYGVGDGVQTAYGGAQALGTASVNNTENAPPPGVAAIPRPGSGQGYYEQQMAQLVRQQSPQLSPASSGSPLASPPPLISLAGSPPTEQQHFAYGQAGGIGNLPPMGGVGGSFRSRATSGAFAGGGLPSIPEQNSQTQPRDGNDGGFI